MQKIRIFFQKKRIQKHFIIFLILSLFIIFVDIKTRFFFDTHLYLDSIKSPLYLILKKYSQIFENFFISLYFHKNIQLDNLKLKKEIFLQKFHLLKLSKIEKENKVLHKLINLPLKQYQKKIFVNILFKDIYRNQLIINHNLKNSIYVGQIAIDQDGKMIGTVISSNKMLNRILLLCSNMHAVPVQIIRNQIRMIAIGKGCKKDLQIKFFPESNFDIRVGDLLVTSGIGNEYSFSEIPVGKISSIKINHRKKILFIQLKTKIFFEKLSYLLILGKKLSVF